MAAAPYLYQGWGSPPNPATVMNATGVRWFTMAFILSNGYCNPMWDGQPATHRRRRPAGDQHHPGERR